MRKNVLLGAPVHDVLEQYMPRYLGSIRAQNCPIMLVDNSTTPDFFDRWSYQVPMIRVETLLPPGGQRQQLALQRLRQYFLEEGSWDYLFIVEQDLSIPMHTLDILIGLDLHHQFDWIGHSYPKHGGGPNSVQDGGSFGITLFSRKLIASVPFPEVQSGSCDGPFWNDCVNPMGYPTLEVWNLITTLEHR